MYMLFSTFNDSPLSFFKNATYPIGLFYIERLLSDLKKEFGEEYFIKNHSLINHAISIGLWHFDVLPKFIRQFLKSKD